MFEGGYWLERVNLSNDTMMIFMFYVIESQLHITQEPNTHSLTAGAHDNG